MQFGADIEQGQVRAANGTCWCVRRQVGQTVCQLCDRQSIEQLDVAQATHTRFEIGLGAMGDLAAALPTCPSEFDEFLETPGDSGAPLPARSADQRRGQLLVAGDAGPPAFPARQTDRNRRPATPPKPSGHCGRAECWRPTTGTTALRPPRSPPRWTSSCAEVSGQGLSRGSVPCGPGRRQPRGRIRCLR